MKKLATFFVGTLAATTMFTLTSCTSRNSKDEEIVSSIPDKMVVQSFTVPATTTKSTTTTTKAAEIVNDDLIMQMHNVKETSSVNTTLEQITVTTVTTVIPNMNQNKEEKPVQNSNFETATQANNSNNVANNNSYNDSTWENNYTETPNSYQEIIWSQSTYTVKAGDCWSSIAESNGVWPPERLAEANHLTLNSALMVGDKLIIPSVYEDYNESSYQDTNYQNNSNSNHNDWSQNSSNQSSAQSSGTCIGSSWLASAPDWASWNNIQVSMNYLNGLTLNPGEYFNWDSYIGWMTADETGVAETGTNPYGYVNAAVFVGTENGSDVGGGICVTSTALMQAARDAGMTIVEKHDHSKRVGYASPGDEASVSYGGLNLVFANTTGHTVVFYTSASYGSVGVSCYIV